jgi:hypothetical protein
MISYGVTVNNDSVLRSVFYKYLHPKEVHIGEGVLVPDIARKKVRIIINVHVLFNRYFRLTYSYVVFICFHSSVHLFIDIFIVRCVKNCRIR